MSLYSAYLLEKTNKMILESDIGFATYEFPDSQTVYIADIFIEKSHRKSKAASKLADQIADIARARGCTKMLGSVIPSTKNSTDSLKVLIAYGMKLESSAVDFILFSKGL